MSRKPFDKFRAFLRQLPDELTAEIKQQIVVSAEMAKAELIRAAPLDEGALAASISVALSSDGLAAAVGPGATALKLAARTGRSVFATRKLSPSGGFSARTKAKLFQARKAYWLEFGTKAGSRKRKVGDKTVVTTWPAQPARPWVSPTVDRIRGELLQGLQDAVSDALDRLGRRD